MSAPAPAGEEQSARGNFVLDVSLSCAWRSADESSEEAWAVLEALPVSIDPPTTGIARHDSLALACGHCLTSYDAARLEGVALLPC